MKRICFSLVMALAGLGYAGTASANLTCSGEKLLSRYLEVRLVHDDGVTTVYYTTTPVVQTDVRLTVTVTPDGQISMIADADEVGTPSRIFSGPLAVQSDGKTYMNLISDSAGDALPRFGIGGHLEQAPSAQSSTAVFQVTGADYQRRESFGVSHALLIVDNHDEEAAQIPLQCH